MGGDPRSIFTLLHPFHILNLGNPLGWAGTIKQGAQLKRKTGAADRAAKSEGAAHHQPRFAAPHRR